MPLIHENNILCLISMKITWCPWHFAWFSQKSIGFAVVTLPVNCIGVHLDFKPCSGLRLFPLCQRIELFSTVPWIEFFSTDCVLNGDFLHCALNWASGVVSFFRGWGGVGLLGVVWVLICLFLVSANGGSDAQAHGTNGFQMRKDEDDAN